MKPSIGRIVIFHSIGGHDLPAIVLKVLGDGTVCLRVLCTDERDFEPSPAHFGTSGGQWSWPERVA